MNTAGPYIVFILVTSALFYGAFLLRKTKYCYKCKAKLPRWRKPKNFKQAMAGGWTCPGCGSELDRYGNDINESKSSTKYLKQVLSGFVKFVLALTLVVVIYAMVIPSLFSVFWGKDIPPIDDTDLLLPIVTLVDEDNMFFDLDRITDDIVYEPSNINFVNDFLESDTWNQDLANDVFEKNEEALALWTTAAEKDDFLLPTLANPNNYDLDSPIIALNRWRSTNRVSLANAVWLAHVGKNDEAITQVMKSIKIGDAMIKSQINLIGYLVGMATKDSSIDGLQKVINIIGADNINKQELLTRLGRYNSSNNEISYFKAEYIMSKNVAMYLIRTLSDLEPLNAGERIYIDAASKHFYYKPNETISYRAQNFRQLILNAQSPCVEHGDIAPLFMYNSAWDYINLYFTENAVGKLITALPMAFNNVIDKTCNLQTKQQEIYDMINNL